MLSLVSLGYSSPSSKISGSEGTIFNDFSCIIPQLAIVGPECNAHLSVCYYKWQGHLVWIYICAVVGADQKLCRRTRV